MTQKSTLGCDVPGCTGSLTVSEPRMSLKRLRKTAAETCDWGTLSAPKGVKIDLCAGCLKEIMKPEAPPESDLEE